MEDVSLKAVLNMSSASEVMKELPVAGLSAAWQKCFSTKHKRDYWFNSTDGSTSWSDPAAAENLTKKRRIEDDISGTDSSKTQKVISSLATSSRPELQNVTVQKNCTTSIEKKPEIAIIVPYRDLHKEQCRKQQLDLFIPSLSKFMELKKERSSYRIYIIEQSDDARKFNRGKLLNIGFKIAQSEGCQAFIFHDVDLLPSAGTESPLVLLLQYFFISNDWSLLP